MIFRCRRCYTSHFEPQKVVMGPRGPKGDKGEKGDTGIGLKIDGTVETEDDLPINVQNGTAYLVGEDNERLLYIYDIKFGKWINEGSLKGEKGETGLQGEKGDKGENGNGIQIDGTVDSEDLLPTQSLTNGLAFMVGAEEPRTLFVFDSNAHTWINQGKIQGDTGQGLRIDGNVDDVDELPKDVVNGTAYMVANGNPKHLFVYDGSLTSWVDEGSLQGPSGATFYPCYASLYSSKRQVFVGGTSYNKVDFQSISLINGIEFVTGNGLRISKSGLYQITYTITPSNVVDLSTVAFLDNENIVKSASVQALQNDVQVSMTFLAKLYAGKSYYLGVLSDNEVVLDVKDNQLVNASLCVVQIANVD